MRIHLHVHGNVSCDVTFSINWRLPAIVLLTPQNLFWWSRGNGFQRFASSRKVSSCTAKQMISLSSFGICVEKLITVCKTQEINYFFNPGVVPEDLNKYWGYPQSDAPCICKTKGCSCWLQGYSKQLQEIIGKNQTFSCFYVHLLLLFTLSCKRFVLFIFDI